LFSLFFQERNKNLVPVVFPVWYCVNLIDKATSFLPDFSEKTASVAKSPSNGFGLELNMLGGRFD